VLSYLDAASRQAGYQVRHVCMYTCDHTWASPAGSEHDSQLGRPGAAPSHPSKQWASASEPWTRGKGRYGKHAECDEVPGSVPAFNESGSVAV
jgi:hypothetical protein